MPARRPWAPEAGQRVGVAILGMHRSGTSAVAGFLAKAGFFAGEEDDLLPAAEDNPKGFFERADVNALNDDLLERLGATGTGHPGAPSWRSVRRSGGPRSTRCWAPLAAEAAGRPLVLKDPRISLLLPAWLPALDDRFEIILVDRNPIDVALSVRKRDGRPLYVALALWQLYCTELLEGLAGKRVLVVRYENFVESPAAAVHSSSSTWGERLPANVAAAGGRKVLSPAICAITRPRPRPCQRTGPHHTQLALYKWLRELPEGWVELQPPKKLRAEPDNALVTAAEYFDAMGDRYGMETAYDTERHRALHFEQATELKDHHIENLETELRHLRRRVREAGATARDRGDQVRSGPGQRGPPG